MQATTLFPSLSKTLNLNFYWNSSSYFENQDNHDTKCQDIHLIWGGDQAMYDGSKSICFIIVIIMIIKIIIIIIIITGGLGTKLRRGHGQEQFCGDQREKEL